MILSNSKPNHTQKGLMPPLAKPLTDTELEKKCGPKKKTYRKPDGNGLYLEIRPSGLKTWLVRTRLPDGKQTPAIAIGHYPEEVPITGMSLAQARVRVIEIHRAAKLGLPIKGLNAQKQENRHLLAKQRADAMQTASEIEHHSFKAVSTKWLAEKRPTWQAETYRKARLIVNTYLIPELGGMDMRVLTTKDVKPVLLVMAKKVPVLARKAKQHIGSIVGYAIDEGMRSDDAVLRLNNLLGMSQEYDAPMFTRFSDSLGNVEHIREPRKNLNYLSSGPLRVGDAIRLEVEVDAHYGEDDYAICWTVSNISNGESGAGKFFSLVLEPRHVNEQFAIQVTLKSRKDWHRMGNIDSYLTINYKVLPPTF